MIDERIPPGIKFDGSGECKCVCHRMHGVRHALACCNSSRKAINEMIGKLTKEDMEKLKEKK